MAYNAPHFPFQAPSEDLNLFPDDGTLHETVRTIYAMNHRMDSGIADILGTLRRLGLEDNTLVVFTSDNGPQLAQTPAADTRRFNGHFHGSKGTVYEGGIRVPAILRWPAGLPSGSPGGASGSVPDGASGDHSGSGRRLDGLMHFTDWLPTLLAVAGAVIPADHATRLDGQNALPFLRGEAPSSAPPRFWQWNRYTPIGTSNAAMRDGPWKLVRPAIAESLRVAPEDSAMDRRLKEVPCTVTDIDRTPEPARDIPSPPAPLLFNMDRDPY